MSHTPSSAAAQLQAAFSALEQSLHRLDQAAHARYERAQQHAASAEGSLEALAEENRFLKDDNLRLTNQLQGLQAEYVALKETASLTLGRMDATITQLDMLLEH